MKEEIKIVVVDDHQLFRTGLIQLITTLNSRFNVTNEFENGQVFIDWLATTIELPTIAILDLSMPILNGFETAAILQEKYPNIHLIALTMYDDQESIVKMLSLGAKGYIGKDIDAQELNHALLTINEVGFYYSNNITKHLINALQKKNNAKNKELNDREKEFILLACSEDTYEKIASIMCLSTKTIDGYRASVFKKLNVKSRVGLVIHAIKTGLYVI